MAFYFIRSEKKNEFDKLYNQDYYVRVNFGETTKGNNLTDKGTFLKETNIDKNYYLYTNLLFDNLWTVSNYTIRNGEFDKYLTRPINSLFYVLVEKFQIDALGELIMGITLICITLPKLSVEFSILKIFFMG